MHKFRILLTAPGRGKVWIDDKLAEGVTAVRVEAGVDRMHEVTLTMHCGEIDIEADVGMDIDVTTIGDTERRFAPGAVS